jgi:hypothetical protein
VTMVLDEGNVKELEAAPLPSRELVPVTEANRQGIIDPLMIATTMSLVESILALMRPRRPTVRRVRA